MSEENKVKGKKKLPTYPYYQIGKNGNQNQAILQRARRMYWEGFSYNDIFKVTKIPLKVYRKHENLWKRMVDREVSKRSERVINQAVEKVAYLRGMTIEVVLRSIERLAVRETELDVREIKLLGDLLYGIDRQWRLNEDKPTDITRYERLTPKQLQEEAVKVLKDLREQDPIIDYDKLN